MGLSNYFQKLWYEKQKPPSLLMPLEKLYRYVSNRRHQRFISNPQRVYSPKAPVIVVGNITVGGTGKTPLTLFLIEKLAAKGLKIGVVSRGYGGKATNYPIDVSVSSLAVHCGDEPLMIHLRTGVPVIVDPNRVAAARYLESNYSVDIIISDDGLQHHPLGRTIEIVVMDAKRGVGNGRCLPAGPLREPVSRLSSVDFLIVNGSLQSNALASVVSDQAISAHKYGMQLDVSNMVPLDSSVETVKAGLGEAVHGVAGIGNPQRFFDTLEALGYQVHMHPFPDHYDFKIEDFNSMTDLPVVMTEKDAVKVRTLAVPGAFYLEVSANIDEQFIDDILCKLNISSGA